MAQVPQPLTRLEPVGLGEAAAVASFLQQLPEGDRTFFKEDVDRDSIERLFQTQRAVRWLLMSEDGDQMGFVAVIPGVAWSAHVGELRLIVDPQHRRRGVGRRLARHAVTEGVRMGLRKLVVEVVAGKEGDLAMFRAIGFEPEALLADHICDRDGNLRDLLLLSHDVEAVAGALGVGGLDRAVDRQAG